MQKFDTALKSSFKDYNIKVFYTVANECSFKRNRQSSFYLLALLENNVSCTMD